MKAVTGTILALIILAAATPSLAGSADFGQTCTFFRNIAFHDRYTRQAETFRMTLSRDCDDALAVVQGAPPGSPRHAQATAYLAHLDHYGAILRDLVRTRFRDGQAQSASLDQPVSRPVSETGSYLIAQRMGLVRSQRAWVASRAVTSVADGGPLR